MDHDKDEDGSGMGKIELKIGNKGIKLTGIKGLFILAAALTAINLGYYAVTGEFINELPDDEPQVSEPASP